MFYGSMLICMMLLGKNNDKDKKLIMNLFLIVNTILALVTLANYYAMESGKDFFIIIKRLGTDMTCGIFNNSNHYGYLLSISVIVAATMAVKEKKIGLKLAYFASFVVMTYMLILNNTFGAYIGVGIALVLMLVHSIVRVIQRDEESKKDKGVSLGITALSFLVLLVLSMQITNANGELIAKKNFEGIFDDVKSILLSTQSDNISTDEFVDIDEENDESNDSSSSADEAGSGRWKLWVGGLKLALKKPIFGYGLENMKAEYIEQLQIGEGRSHNLIIQLAGTTGFPGMILYITGIMMILFRNLKYYKEWDMFSYTGVFVIISYIISSIVGNSGFYTSGYFYIFVALIALTPKKKKISEK